MQLQYGYVHTYLEIYIYIYIYAFIYLFICLYAYIYIQYARIPFYYLFVSFITWIHCASFFRRIVWVESSNVLGHAMPSTSQKISCLISLFPHQMAMVPHCFSHP